MDRKSNSYNSKVCRLCPSEYGLFDLYHSITLDVRDVLNLLVNIKDENTTTLPKFICGECKVTLERIVAFRCICKEREIELLEIFEEAKSKNCIKLEELHPLKHNFTIEEINIKEEIVELSKVEFPEENHNKEFLKKNSHRLLVKKEHNCNLCEKVYTKLNELTDHKNADHLQCPVCSKIFSSYQLMVHHKRNIHAGSVNCHICGKFLLSRTYLATHIRKDHKNERNHRCDICGTEFFRASKLKVHLSTHNEVKTEICDFDNCGKLFKSIINLKQHKRTHFPQNMKRTSTKRPAKTIVCQCCGKILKTSQGYNTHMRGHRKEKPYDCKDCDKKFRDMSALTVHKRTHQNIRPYQCDLCPKSFYVLAACQNHKINIHGTEMKHECHICGKRTKLKSNLTTHMKIHGVGINKNDLE